MTIESWIGWGGHWFVDRDLGHVQVGEAHEDAPVAFGTSSSTTKDFLVAISSTRRGIFLENTTGRQSYSATCDLSPEALSRTKRHS